MRRGRSTRTARLSHDWEMVEGIGVSGMFVYWARVRGRGRPRHTLRILHDRWHCDAHHGESANQFAANHGDRGQEGLFSFLIGLAQDGMAVIERVEELCQLEGMLCKIGGLCGGDALVDQI